MGKTVISANNSFLTNIGIIEGGKTKSATSRGADLAKALEHEIPDEIQRNWARVVNENEFLNKMAVAVKIRKAMESSAFEAHIAYSAGEAKVAAVMTGARTVIDILRAAGVVGEKNGQLVAGEPIESPGKEVAAARVESAPSNKDVPSKIDYELTDSFPPGRVFTIQLRISAKPDELEGLGTKIRNLIRDIQGAPENDEGGTTPES